MAPKKKSNKKANDDWEAELGESADPVAAATLDNTEVEASNGNQEDEPVGGGGLLAALKKNKSKKQKKGVGFEDFVEGQSASEVNGNCEDIGNSQADLATKAPEEATPDDLFASHSVKGKGGKGSKQGKVEVRAAEEEDDDDGDGSKMKTKKEKEKEKKEREKQRKKEQV